MKLTVTMPWERDLSVNHYRFGAGGGYRKKPHVCTWMERLHWRAFDAWCLANGIEVDTHSRPPSVPVPIKIIVEFRYPDNRKRDDHNYYKVLCDAVAAGLGIDDKDIRVRTGTVEVDRENPGFTITVEDGSK